MWLTRVAMRRPVTVVMLLISVLLLGAISIRKLPLNFLPNEEFPFIGVFIPYPNGVPSQVEREIARPVEEILATLGGVKEVFSESDPDQCFIGVEFEWGRDVNVLRLEVKEKLDQIRPELPRDVRDLFLFTFNTNDIPIVEGRISAVDRDISASYDLIETRIVNRLERVPGVGRVMIEGVQPADISVYLKLDQIKEHKVDVGRLFAELSQSNFNLTVGRVTERGLRYDLRAVGTLTSREDLENLPLDDRGLRLRDVADIEVAVPEVSFGRFLNREPAVAFWIQKASGANTVEVVREIKKELDVINNDPTLEGFEVLLFFDQGKQITESLSGLLHAGLIGGAMAVGILFFFLLRIGTTLIVAMAIPVSAVGTACFLYLSGGSLNILSMMGLMLAVGMLIDNAVVVLESIYRRMALGESPEEATLGGTRDVARAIVSSTLCTIIVFAPIIVGARSEITIWLKEVGVTITAALLLSLLVSLTLIPMFTARFLRGGRESVARNPIVDRGNDAYARVLRWTAIRRPWITGLVIAPAIVILTAGIAVLGKFKPDPFGERGIRHEYLQIEYSFTDNLNYKKTRDCVDRVEASLWALRDTYDLEHLYSFYADNRAGTRLYFRKSPLREKDLEQYRKQLRKDLPTLAGVTLMLGDDEEGSRGGSQLVVTLHGEDGEELARLADETKRRLAMIPDVLDVATDLERGAEEVQVRVDPEKARRLGLSPEQIAQLVGITFRGVQLPRFHAADREIDLRVQLDPDDRRNIEDIQALTVATRDGRDVTLGQVATTVVGRGSERVTRLNQRTSVTVTGRYEGEDMDGKLGEVRAVMSSLSFPPNYGWNFGSHIQEAHAEQNEMLINILLAIACVFMVMASLFESLSHPTVVMTCLPFAWLGVIWFMVPTHTPFNIMAMIGIVILNGVVVNNGIVLVHHINHHRRDGRSLEDAILMGSRERFRPILMTALTTILGLVPLSLGESSVGDAQMYPMARALMGGMVSSTFLTLILLPVYYHLNERVQARLVRIFPGLVRLRGRLRFRRPRWETMMKRGLGALAILGGLLFARPALAGGEIYGSVFTLDGRSYTGIIRWDRNEAFWNDLMDATKLERVPGVQQGEGLDLGLFDQEFSRPARRSKEGTHNALSVPFGHVRRVERGESGRVRLELKNGSHMEVIGSGDLGGGMRGLQIEDESQGRIELSWDDVESAHFLPSPPSERDAERLYGQVSTVAGDFTGYVVWGGEKCLRGDVCSLGRPVPFSEVSSIERLPTGEGRLSLRGGNTESIPAATVRASALEVSVAGLGRVAVGWEGLRSVRFAACPPSPPYNAFDGGRHLYGTVQTTGGARHTGEIVWDQDERHSWESLDGESAGVDFMVLFEHVLRIERRSPESARVVLRDGRTLDLSGSNDVNRYNRGILVRAAGGEEVEVDWNAFVAVEFMSS